MWHSLPLPHPAAHPTGWPIPPHRIPLELPMADSTESRIRIAAPPASVLGVIADLEAYPEWNEEVRRVEVLARDDAGRPAEVRFELDAGPIQDTYVLAYAWQRDGVSWRLVEGQLVSAMDGAYDLRGAEQGGTDVTYRLAVDLKIPMIGLLKRKGERVIIERALKGLKKRVESRG